MPNFAHLKPLVEAKSGATPVSCEAVGLRSGLGHDVNSMRAGGYDPGIIAEHVTFNEQLEPFLVHAQFGEYLANLMPQQIYVASGVRVLSLDAIREEIQQLAPGARVFPHGYMPFATSIGGNAVCFHVETGRVVWADRDSFGTDSISYKDRSTGEYRTASFTPEQIAQAVVPLGDFGAFLTDLLNDRLEARLDELD